MVLNKRFVGKEIIYEYILGSKTLEDIFKIDNIIMLDKVASEAFKLYTSKIDSETIKLKLNQYYGYETKKTSIV